MSIAAAASIFVYLFRPQASLGSQAAQLATAALSNDCRGVYHFMSKEEAQALNLDEAKFCALWEELIEPRLKRAAVIGTVTQKTNHESGQGVASAQLRVGPRMTFFGATVLAADEGRAEAMILMQVLSQAWLLDYLADHLEQPMDENVMVRAKIAGLKKDRTALERYGVPGFFMYPGQPIDTWDVLVERWERRLKRTQ